MIDQFRHIDIVEERTDIIIIQQFVIKGHDDLADRREPAVFFVKRFFQGTIPLMVEVSLPAQTGQHKKKVMSCRHWHILRTRNAGLFSFHDLVQPEMHHFQLIQRPVKGGNPVGQFEKFNRACIARVLVTVKRSAA